MNKFITTLKVWYYDAQAILIDYARVVYTYFKNVLHALAGLTENKYRELRLNFAEDIMRVLEENDQLRKQVKVLSKNTIKKTATVAKKAPTKKKTSGK